MSIETHQTKTKTTQHSNPQILHLRIQPNADQKYSEHKPPESSKQQNVNLLHVKHYAESM